MKIAVVGAFGNLGTYIFKDAINNGYDVIGYDQKIVKIEGIENSKIKTKEINIDKIETLKGIFEGIDVVISTLGLVGRSSLHTPHDLDYLGNSFLLKEAIYSGVKKFIYISHINCETDKVPVLKAKRMFENELINSDLDYLIIRPTTFFNQLKKDFSKMHYNGKIEIVSYKDYKVNCIHPSDVSKFIFEHINDSDKVYTIGGKEVYSYKEIFEMFNMGKEKKIPIKRISKIKFSLEGRKNKKYKNGILIENIFQKWRYTHDLISQIKYGDCSFKEYISLEK